MALLPILRFPDPRLHTIAKPVAAVDERIRRLVDDMLQTMYEADGVGLAATQVDVHERVIVMDTSEGRDEPRVLINPELVERSEEMHVGEEGCLSVPTIVGCGGVREQIELPLVAKEKTGLQQSARVLREIIDQVESRVGTVRTQTGKPAVTAANGSHATGRAIPRSAWQSK